MVYKLSSVLALVATLALTGNAQKQIQGLTFAGNTGAPDSSFNLPKNALAEAPISDLKSKAFACRSNGFNFPAIKSYSATGGEMFIVTWDKAAIEASGKSKITGPCNHWLASTAAGTDNLKWFRIGEVGYSAESGWCTDIIRKDGQLVVSMPDDLPVGDYIFRSEVIDLTYAGKTSNDDPTMGAQFYADCLKYSVTGGKNQKMPTEGLVSLPGAYLATDKGLLLNLTADGKPPAGKYTVPGPALHQQRK
ncbi:hypothetical protein GGH94_001394 [Coemansia aciculifera]|uniref:lytic cellulose monooxygenase (C4-dehydrogenating) n=2 Tax=Coemansia TaxID=4863 RepID=A0A9W8GZF3_9FUNG|nr:hypothetical protein GGI19_000413 [Coemansia pectinata]KAJ2866668.1 hypothetical protein GGH94_001394 [Coemansia aciculifera]KAJ2874802.1 hypothetical protein GGH93_002109 [Coemansia aciculifera]KAJ2886142.1 hypothetical protein H4R27_000863 [Coemansia aciculifera]